MNKKKEVDSNLSSLLSNPIVMGIGAIAMIPDILPILIGGFIGFIISKNKKEQDGKKYEKQNWY